MARRRKGNTDSQYYYKWLEKALSDLQSARILLTWGGDEMAVAFHCQQAIEKALKGYLLFKLGRHFDGHNLTFLCRQAAMADERFARYLGESAALNNYYIETRYPTDLPFEITEAQIHNILIMAEDLFNVIRQELYATDEEPHEISR
ncbi:MAG: HEPN domain-containing protein [Clostridia bacterium]|nr:HEPN domain-containing protein [Clostridia bacterium]